MTYFPSARTLLCSFLLAAPTGLVANPPSGGGGGTPTLSRPSGNGDAAAEYRKGLEALQAERYAEALKALKHVLAVAPNDANTNFLAGLAAAGMDDLKGARRYYQRAVRADKDLVGARRELGLVHAKTGDRAKAEEELSSLRKLQEKCAASCDKAAEIDAAVSVLTQALSGAPAARLDSRGSLLFASAARGERVYLEAVGLINEGRYAQAIDSLEAARAAFGPHPDILTYLGFAHRKLGRNDRAESHYKAALAAAPGHRAATGYYGELMVERGDEAGARRLLASLDASCSFGCAEAEELRRWIETGRDPAR